MSAMTGLWEKLVRRAYPAQLLAQTLGRDVKEIGRWCEAGVPHGFQVIVASVLELVPERMFCVHPRLPTGWVRVAECDGGACTQRQWLELRDAPLTLADALHLDQLGYGALMHRPIQSRDGRHFALEFHLLPGCVAGVPVSCVKPR